jgi:hypothetical protein
VKVTVLSPPAPDIGLIVSHDGTDAASMFQLSTALTVIEVDPPACGRATYDEETLTSLRYVASLSSEQLVNIAATTATRDGMKYLSFIFS